MYWLGTNMGVGSKAFDSPGLDEATFNFILVTYVSLSVSW